YWLLGDSKLPRLSGPVVHFLPNYDEHLIAYKERSAAFDRDRVKKVGRRDLLLGNHLITLNGRLIGGWRREPKQPIEITLIARLHAEEKRALREAQERLERFSEAD
ncbi:MAG TPA: crosslink repair DNA glycosylase YcaQ family protein, partial [Polyangiales bacterium]|nr:crosslink repair DNA glycosylase YcaQ family protein [Polyangiales bacterium]